MNDLKMFKSEESVNDVQTISSREVAEMMEKKHNNLLRDIEKHIAILEEATELNFKLADLWQLSSYKDSTGRTLKEYLVTKKGCEFLIQNTTGKKGFLLASKLDELFPNEPNSIIITEINRKEIEFLDELEDALSPFNIKGIRQYSVIDNKYRIDYYIPSINVAIEYDENNHRGYSYEKHEGRQREIEDLLKCKFIRISDDNTNSYNIGFVLKNIFNL